MVPLVNPWRLTCLPDEKAGEEIAQVGCLSQWMTRLFKRSGRLRNGLSSGVAPPTTT